MAEAAQSRRALFRYRAMESATGRIRTGEQDGESAYAVRASLRRIGLEVLQVVDVTPGRTTTSAWLRPLIEARDARRRRLNRVAKADLSDGLATLILAGIPIEQAVASLASSQARPAGELRLLRALRDRLREGTPFATACEEHPAWFDRFDVALLDAGQRAGELASTLQNLAQHHHRAGAFGQKVFVALAYPAVLVAAGLAALVFMSFQTLPQLVTMIEQGRHQPPALTTTVIALGQGLATWWPVVIAGGMAAVIGLRRLVLRVPPESRLGQRLHGNPLARMLGRIRVAHLAAALARLRRAGTPLAEALVIVADTISDRAVRTLILQAVEAIRRGEDLSTVIAGSRLLDPEFAQLLQLGERSGELTEMLERIAERYQRSADRAGDRLAAVLGPAAIIILAALIGTLVMAAVLPLMQLGDLV
jgi:type II secretory pathway component PulF